MSSALLFWMVYCATQGHTLMVIPFMHTPYMHWETVAYQNVTPASSVTQHGISGWFSVRVSWKVKEYMYLFLKKWHLFLHVKIILKPFEIDPINVQDTIKASISLCNRIQNTNSVPASKGNLSGWRLSFHGFPPEQDTYRCILALAQTHTWLSVYLRVMSEYVLDTPLINMQIGDYEQPRPSCALVQKPVPLRHSVISR